MTTRTIRVNALARVEGEGSLHIRIHKDRPHTLQLKLFEPPRLFEGFLVGRHYTEAPDITARICGICPVAYQMSACQAMEAALGLQLPSSLTRLRRLLYCGEWIESHVLHMFMLHLPDFLHMADVLEVSRSQPTLVKDALRIKKAGNAIVQAVGGREIHPINVRVGGFYRVPTSAEIKGLLPELCWAKDTLTEHMKALEALTFPDVQRDYELVCLKHPDVYPFCEGRLTSNRGIDIPAAEFEHVFEERQMPHTTALHSVIKKRGYYLTGPLARFNLCFEQLRPHARSVADRLGLAPPMTNPFKSLLVRGVESLQALDEAIEIVETYTPPAEAWLPHRIPAGATGHGATEAPRGVLYHRYTLDKDGLIRQARIIPPTAQNQGTIEDDLRALVPRLIELPLPKATWLAEQGVRNHDPCISCATHFLRLKVEYG